MTYNYNYRDEQGKPAPKMLLVNGCQVWNPTVEQYAAHGYLQYTPPEPVPPTDEEIAESQRKERIKELYKLLEKTDYKVIKNNEFQILGLPLPYNPQEVHDEKQAWRDELNRLEGSK